MNLSAHIDSSKWNVTPRHLVSLEQHSAAFNYIGEQIWLNIERINTPPPNYYSKHSEKNTRDSVNDIRVIGDWMSLKSHAIIIYPVDLRIASSLQINFSRVEI